MTNTEIASLGDEALVHREMEMERRLVELGFRHRTGQLEDTSKLGQIRRDIARLRTAQRAREIEQGLNKDSLRARHRGSWSAAAAQAEVAQQPKAAGGGFLKGIVDKIKGTE